MSGAFPFKGSCRAVCFVALAVVLMPILAATQQPFPPPEFESGYEMPSTTFVLSRPGMMPYADAALLVLALFVCAWLVHTRRSRKGILILGLLCLAYFGFYRKGCVCAVGSVQNVVLGIFDSSLPVSIPVIAIFIAPLVFALLCGRVFCGAVCPLGMIQDVFIFKPLRVRTWLEQSLSLFRFVFLGLAVYFVLTSKRFIICEYDPFVGFFRMGGFAWKLFLGAGILVLGIFVARPYCRYLCPYGALLSLFSRWSNIKVRVTPDECIRCGLCEAKCPFGAIMPPREASTASASYGILGASVVMPLALGLSGYYVLGRTLGGALLGLWFGILISARLVGLIYFGKRTDFEADPSACLVCGRCFKWCPRDRVLQEAEGKSVE